MPGRLPLTLLMLWQAAAAAEDAGGPWSLASGADAADYGDEVVLRQESGDSIGDEDGTQQVHPVLELYCAPGRAALGVRIDWRRFVSSFNTEVGFSIDGGKTSWLKLGVDASNRVTHTDKRALVDELLGMMKNGQALSVEVAPYAGAPVTAGFDLAGFEEALAGLTARCE